MSRYIVNTGMQEIQMEAATGSQVEKETQESRWSDESYSDKDVGPVVPVKTYRNMKVIWMILLLILLYVLGYEIYKAKRKTDLWTELSSVSWKMRTLTSK